MKIVLASNNPGKLAEFRQNMPKHKILSLKDLNIDVEINETGRTFYENALIKANEVAKYTKYPVIADDSGLLVDVLNGEPGIMSARYAGENATDEENMQKLLKALKNKKDRRAKFMTTIVLRLKNGKIISASAGVAGSILEQPVGKNGFGYDPLFYCDELDKPFGVATEEEKNSVSHRSRAIALILSQLKKGR